MSDDEERRPKAQGPGLTARQEYWLGLYQQYHEEIRRYFARRVKCSHDADDLMQMVFLHLIAHRGDLQNPHAYLCAMARHQLSFYWRCRNRSVLTERALLPGNEDSADETVFLDCDSDPLRQLSRQEMYHAVDAMIDSLSPALSEALRLRYVDGLQPRAAATLAGCSRAALKKRLGRAKRSLLGCLRMGGGPVGE
jgi:RNA polymerase sigma-70 factor (ECF subfamily)